MELSTKATEINAVTCNYGNLVSIYLHRFAVDSIQTLSLEHMSHGTTTISGSTCCFRKLVAMATEELLSLFWHFAWKIYRILDNFIKWFTCQY